MSTQSNKSDAPGSGKSVVIVAGEASGDLHASHLARKLLTLDPGLTLKGMGGDNMRRAGVDILFDASELAVVAVLAAYMGGLALGAAIASRIVGRLTRPVLAYGLLPVPFKLLAARLVWRFPLDKAALNDLRRNRANDTTDQVKHSPNTPIPTHRLLDHEA